MGALRASAFARESALMHEIGFSVSRSYHLLVGLVAFTAVPTAIAVLYRSATERAQRALHKVASKKSEDQVHSDVPHPQEDK